MNIQKYKRRRLEESNIDESASESWMTSYADMMSLLFALFTVLYALGMMNKVSFSVLVEALSGKLAKGGVVSRVSYKEYTSDNMQKGEGKKELKEAIKVFLNGDRKKEVKDSRQELKERKKDVLLDEDLTIIEKKLKRILLSKGYSKATMVRFEERGLVVSLMTDRLLFNLGEADLTAKCKRILDVIISVLCKYKNPLRIEGNTCNLPIHNSRFRSNWELSTMRATNVAKYLITIKKVRPERVSLVGYGEYRPMFPNTSEVNRIKNRRVDIVILNSRGGYSPAGTSRKKKIGKKLGAREKPPGKK